MKFRLILIGLLLPFSLFAQSSGDTAFLTARDAFRAGDINKLERAASVPHAGVRTSCPR